MEYAPAIIVKGWSNFSIWRGRLPHWRADDVRYYATFRHRRSLSEAERRQLLNALLKPDGRKWNVLVACVLPEQTEMILEVRESPIGSAYELSDVLENAKSRAGKEIIKASGESYPPFFGESYDRIMRDESELQTFWDQIVESPVAMELVEESEDYPGLWVADAPN